ncbi:MAG: alkaline phosphatase family protein [Bacteroidales bacterium]|nr:alkaline phosphatase family protein [Bacteroidales bacterium]
MKKKFFAVLALLICATSAYTQPNVPVIVGIVVQQMRYDAIARYAYSMGNNGFLRIINQGAYCTNAYYDYMLTEPAPAYATIYTGGNPSNHGIISNNWYDRLSRKTIEAVRDPKYAIVGTENITGAASPLNLLGTTLGDELKLSNFKQSKVVSISWNDYGAVLPAGRLADGAYWFDEKSGNMVSSSYYTGDLPQWVKDFNSRNIASSYMQRNWFTIKSSEEYRASLPDNSIYEHGIEGRSTFPYNIKDLTKEKGNGFQVLKYTPWADDLICEFATKAIEQENLGGDEFTDLLMINFAAPGYISDVFGIRSMELQDSYIRLDYSIATILATLDAKIGKGNYIVFFTADRGSADSPMFLSDMGMPGRQINVQGTMILLEAYLRALYGDEKWVEKYSNHQVYLNRIAVERYKVPLDQVQNMASEFLVQIDGIDHAMPSHILTSSRPNAGIWRQAANSFCRDRSGDIIINLSPGWQDITPQAQDRGFSCSAQNSAYNHDTHVPLAFFGKGINMRTINRRVSIADITPTLATLIQILSPDYSSGEPIYEAIDDK